MRPLLLRAAFPALLAVLGAPVAHADVYTWTDASGRLNVSNIAPPEGVHVSRVVHEDPAKVSANATAARNATRAAEVEALNERVAQLTDEVDRAKRQPPPVPLVPYRAAPPAPPVQLTVNVMPSAPAADYSAGYPYPGYAGHPYPGYPGLPRDYCDPTVFGCPLFGGYPVGVVVLNTPRFHRFNRSDRFGGHRVVARSMPPAAGFHRR